MPLAKATKVCTPQNRLLVYSDAFCPLSETFIYRMTTGMSAFAPTILTHKRMNIDEFPDAGLNINVIPFERKQPFRRAIDLASNFLKWKIPAAEILSENEIQLNEYGLRPNIILAHFATCGFRILPASLSLRIPLVTMFHGCDLGSWLQFPRYTQCLYTLFRAGTAFIVATDFMRKKAITLGCPSRKIHTIPYPIPQFSQVNRSLQTDTNGHPFRFLHVGRLHEQKGILFSIKAFSKVHEVLAQTEFIIIGDGPQKSEAQQLVRDLSLSDCVIFRGALPFSKVRIEYELADAYIIHSVTTKGGDTEGFGVSLAEASEAGLPIVATIHNGFPDVVLEATSGFLIPEGNIQAMAGAMLKLANDPVLCLGMGAQGRCHVREMFSPMRVNLAYERLLHSVLYS